MSEEKEWKGEKEGDGHQIWETCAKNGMHGIWNEMCIQGVSIIIVVRLDDRMKEKSMNSISV